MQAMALSRQAEIHAAYVFLHNIGTGWSQSRVARYYDRWERNRHGRIEVTFAHYVLSRLPNLVIRRAEGEPYFKQYRDSVGEPVTDQIVLAEQG